MRLPIAERTEYDRFAYTYMLGALIRSPVLIVDCIPPLDAIELWISTIFGGAEGLANRANSYDPYGLPTTPLIPPRARPIERYDTIQNAEAQVRDGGAPQEPLNPLVDLAIQTMHLFPSSDTNVSEEGLDRSSAPLSPRGRGETEDSRNVPKSSPSASSVRSSQPSILE